MNDRHLSMKPGDAPDASHRLCRADARLKLLVAAALLVMIASSRNVILPLLAGGASLAVCLSLRVRPRLLLTRFAEPLLIAAVIVLLKSLGPGKTLLYSCSTPLFDLAICREGLLEGLKLAARITGGIAVVAATGFATSFTELLAALSWLRVPREITEVALFAWRYLFVLADDARVIHAAQKNRLGYVGLVRSFRSIGTLAGALVIKAFDASQAMTVSMVQRGYDGRLPTAGQKPLNPAELFHALSILAVMGLLWSV